MYTLLIFTAVFFNQTGEINLLGIQLVSPLTDTLNVSRLVAKSKLIQLLKPDSALIYAQQGLDYARTMGYKKGEADCLNRLGVVLMQNGKYDKALANFLSSLKIREKINDLPGVLGSLNNMGIIYSNQSDYKQALLYHFKAKKIAELIQDKAGLSAILSNIGNCYIKLNRIDSALNFEMQAYSIQHTIANHPAIQNTVSILGDINYKMGHKELALDYYRLALKYASKNNDKSALSDTYNSVAKLYDSTARADLAIVYARNALNAAKSIQYPEGILTASNLLTRLYSGRNEHYELLYIKMASAAKDSLYNLERIKQIQELSFSEAARQQEIAQEQKREAEKRIINLQLIAIAVFIPTFFLIFLILTKSHTHPRVIEFMGVTSLLLVFEFITLFIHPFVLQISNHLPAVELLIMVIVAAVLVPMHHKLTHWLKEKLVQAKHHRPAKPGIVKPAGKNDSEQ